MPLEQKLFQKRKLQVCTYNHKGFSPEPKKEPRKELEPLKVMYIKDKLKYSKKTNANDIDNHKVSRHWGKPAADIVTHKTVKLLSTNCAGLVNGKIDSLKNEVIKTEATVVTVQETHCLRKGRIKIENMVVFEAIRTKKGGGTLCAVHKDLNPHLIEEYNDPFELLVVEVVAGNKDIRIITGYGPQENWDEERRLPFFRTLEEEVIKAANAGKSIVIEMDSNSKLGTKFIPDDPHEITPNGKLLALIIERQNLTVANGTNKCKGVITRKRITKTSVEESAIDIVIISKDMEEQLEKVEIDEARKHVLTRIRKTKNGVQVKESDHNVIITTFNNKFTISSKEDKVEIFNLKNKDNQKKFKEYTSNLLRCYQVFLNQKKTLMFLQQD